ncbi:general substrate transporter [Truncatella angustata]|uniref:General substrate transporter n=1 Tax=Truncatella angustata TaxID=152316 RepID=A0A9P8ZZ00_9PEZI|nr:general substrate transporter [Truncatella angustata]KAH6654515.1 general substrate transporter [Truncatella angustata]
MSNDSSFEKRGEDTKDSVEHHEIAEKLDQSSHDPIDGLDTIELTKTGYYSWLVSITAGLGGVLFGYDTGIIAAVLIYIGGDLNTNLTAQDKELITSITSGGAFIGAIFAGFTADRYGRKIAIYVGCALFIIGAILQAAAFSLAQMVVGRLVVGFGVGSAAMIVPLYIAEVSPAKYRGRMIGLDNMSITGGQLVSYGVGAGFAHVTGGWRYMVGGGALPAILLWILLLFCPESPRQLILFGKHEAAKDVIRRIYPNGTEEEVENKVRLISWHVDQAKQMHEGKSQWWILKQLYVIPANFRALVSACGLMAISQLTGFNSLMYYSPTIFAQIGFANPVAVGTIIAGVNFFFTFVNLLLVDRVGRRRILLCTVQFMGFFLIIAAVAFAHIPTTHDLKIVEGASITWQANLVLASMICFVGFYSSGIGNTAWLSSEFFPMEVRSMGTMMMTMSCWGSNIIVASTFLTQMENTTPSGAFGFYAAICIVGYVCIYFCYPEVAGLSLEDIRQIFSEGFGVKKASQIQKEMKAQRISHA